MFSNDIFINFKVNKWYFKVLWYISETNDEVTKLLTNTHLRNLLVTVDNSENPVEIMQKAMQEPIFVEFADACLKVVEPEESKENLQDWTYF